MLHAIYDDSKWVGWYNCFIYLFIYIYIYIYIDSYDLYVYIYIYNIYIYIYISGKQILFELYWYLSKLTWLSVWLIKDSYIFATNFFYYSFLYNFIKYF